MPHPEHLGVQARRYPDNESYIAFDANDFGMISTQFKIAVQDIGNDTSAAWPSLVDNEKFSLTYLRVGDTLNENRYWPVWSLSFEKAAKTLIVDVGRLAIDRLVDGVQVPGSGLDTSDVNAACDNLNDYTKLLEESATGMGTFQLRMYGILDGRAVPSKELDS